MNPKLYTTRSREIESVDHDALCGRSDCLKTGRAEAVDCGATRRDGTPCPQGTVASNVHARLSFGHATAHYDILHRCWIDARLGNGGLDRMASKHGSVRHVESATKGLGEAGAGRAHNQRTRHARVDCLLEGEGRASSVRNKFN